MKKRSATVQDVARAAGVSTATVSRAINEPDKVSEDTRARVAEAIASTRYTLNEAARSLRMRRTRMLLVTVPDIANPYFSQLLGGMEAAASEQHYHLLIANTRRDPGLEHRLFDYVRSNRADGILILDGTLPSLEDGTSLPPVVIVSERIEGSLLPSVTIDNIAAAREATQHLIDLGHRHIGHLCGPADNVLTRDRLAGYQAALRAHALPQPEHYCYHGDFSMAAGAEAAKRWLTQEDRPQAMTCANDEMAFGFIDELRKAGIRVPEDISVIGFDDIEFSARFYPSLSTVRQPRREIGYEAASLLLALINEPQNTGPQHRTLPTTLVVRQSTCAPASS